MSLEVRFTTTDWSGSLDVLIAEIRDGDIIQVCKPVELVMEHYEPHATKMIEPTFRIPFRRRYDSFLKSLATELQRMDVRPADESKLIGELSATKFHLEDLRTMLKLSKP